MKTKGRIWQTDDKGYILNDAQRDAIAKPYQPLIKDIVAAYEANIGRDVHSIYVTGSVARGLALPGQSDMDVFGVLAYHVDPELVMQDWIATSEEALSRKYGKLVSDVQLELWPQGYVFLDPDEFSVGAFIIKTHAVCVWGNDLAPEVPEYNLNDEATRIAIANDDVVQMKPDIEEAIEEIEADTTPENVAYWCKRICKNIIRAGFGLVMVQAGVHSRDIDIAADYFMQHYPHKADETRKTRALIANPTGDAPLILAHLRHHGAWMITECEQWLDRYHPARDLAYRFDDEGDDNEQTE